VERRKGERAHRWVRKTPRRKPGWLVRIAHIERGHGLTVVRNERKAVICSDRSFDEASARRSWRANTGALAGIQAPPALRTPLAKGQRNATEEANSEWRVANREDRVE
jgi:hypothetical protein